jgi:hypothetical protein
MSTQNPTIHALLIGINEYLPNKMYDNLSGAVRDINLVNAYLLNTLKIPVESICKLTSPAGPGEQVPTYANIVKAFDEITKLAQPGEQVYVHYSGHGGRATSIYPFKQEENDEALVPMDIGDSEQGQYLRDVELTTLLKRMTDKGLIVTIVLDSCNSGGATRGEAKIRGGPLDPVVRSTNSLVERESGELERNWVALTQHAGIGAAGLPESREYVLLAACRPNEYAYEYPVNGSTDQHGALTYWMIDTLTGVATSGQPLTYKLLHDRINAQVQSKLPQQTPMILGESDRLVFGHDTWSTPFTVILIKVISETQVKLNAGEAQGLSKGTRFAIYPLNTTDFTNKADQVAIIELSQVGAGESTATVLQPDTGGIAIKSPLEPGAPAIMVSAPIELIQRVRLCTSKVAGDRENELPANLVDLQLESLEKVRLALAGNGWVIEAQPGEANAYQVAIDREGNYEICRESPINNLRPLLSIEDPKAPQRVVDRLMHLAKYQAVESLDNSSSSLAGMLDIQILQENGQPFPAAPMISIKSEDVVCLRLTNQGKKPLKVAVLDIEPNWAISQIDLGGLEEPFFPLAPNDVKNTLLMMRVSDDSAYDKVKEIIKVFAVQSGLADFRWLTLKSLDEPPVPRGPNLKGAMRELVEHSSARGMSGEPEEVNQLNHLMEMIGEDLDKPPMNARSATLKPDPKQEWVTKQVAMYIER